VVLDTLGELATLYRLCTLAFVGGSLVPIGGHNILEPAVYAKPVVFGPHMHHFPELAAMLCDAGGALQVRNAEELYAGMARLVQFPGEGERMGQRARCALMAHRGALDQIHHRVVTLLQERVA
jgi:3-deoxy-D-manno-octulosonic-acid transferase